MLRSAALVYLSILLTFVGMHSHAQETEPTDQWLLEGAEGDEGEADGRIGIAVQKATVYVDDAQARATERFSYFMNQVDGFFGDTDVRDTPEYNNSWARIRLDARRPAGQAFDLNPSLKIRTSLPETEKRLKLLFSTEEGDTGIVGDSVGGAQSVSGESDQNASFAIRFIRSARAKANVNLDIGIRQRDSKVQFFTRLNTGGRRDIGDYWTVGFSNSYYYFNRSGYEDKLSFTFRRAQFVKEDIFFRSFTEFNWRNGRQGAIIGQTFGLYTQFGERKSLAFELLAGYYTSLNEGIDDRFRGHEIRFRWRHNIWRPWFYYEFWPAVSWPATNDYNRANGFLLRAEVVIGRREG